MTHALQDPHQWPAPLLALDHALDIAGVIANTGCTEEDFADLAEIFLQEQANMSARLERAVQAMQASRGSEGWAQAAEQLRTAAHELSTSFGIIGAKRAEAYARQTQLRTRKGSPLADPPPTEEDLLTAAQALLSAVNCTADLLRQRV